jgi:hypothetical protein
VVAAGVANGSVADAVGAQVAIAIGMYWNLFPREMVRFGQQDALSYLLSLVGGCVVAFHLDQVHTWVCAHARLVVALTAAAALAAEGIYFLAAHGVITVLGSRSDPFQPSVIPFNVGAVTCGYLAGVALVRPGRSRRVKAVVRSGSDNAYGVYLSHMLFIIMLTWVCLATVAIVFPAAIALTSVLARTPLAVLLTGRTQCPGGGRGVSRRIPSCSVTRTESMRSSRSPREWLDPGTHSLVSAVVSPAIPTG